MILGTIAGISLLPGPRTIHGVTFDVHTLLFSAVLILLGFQSVNFAVFTKVFAITEGLAPEDQRMNRLFRYITLEVGLIIGVLLVAAGLAAWIFVLGTWRMHHLGALDPQVTLRIVIPGAVLLAIGFETVLSSFFLSVLGMARK